MNISTREDFIEREETSWLYIRRELTDGTIDRENVLNENDPNYTPYLEDQLYSLEDDTIFLGCVNYLCPITNENQLYDVINGAKYSSIAGYVVQVYDYPFSNLNADIQTYADLFWRTHLKCVNCGISLTIRDLTLNNIQVDEYFNNYECVIFDAGCVDFFCKEFV